MGKATEWSLWANFMALSSCAMLVLGGIIVLSMSFPNFWTGIYGLAVSPFIYVYEWPRGKMKRGRTFPRRFQGKISNMVSNMGFFGSNYYFRFVLYLLVSVPCFFELATTYAGFFFLCTSSVYLLSAVRGEKWVPIKAPRKPELIAKSTQQNGILPFAGMGMDRKGSINAAPSMASAGV
ncbi:hypothetical protein SARC_06336 [Sphaeroforma arctica JP610]|uniref:p22-phox n=1 Tax=Sphaeroforma arctica JP610 TaxID=667725 RepID=A0A0L0FZE5_9EUKA|nr:hypothetical protein SARC_06336 [Sphaeroforma arctica JP610]KNC81338.1 hypothetical protein SARC_06336 [Sphaeroforma arctica JP610]|eukprot:XP_014155240.1 hypothetical protein SARC_06336 [Sphaeroforma arctica JP610]